MAVHARTRVCEEAMKTVAYIRVSTAEQADQGVSLEAQAAHLSAYCIAQGWPQPEIREDAGVSAKSLDRPALGRIFEAIPTKTGGRWYASTVKRIVERPELYGL